MNEDTARQQEQSLTELVDTQLNEKCPRCGSDLKVMDTSTGQEVEACENQCGWIGESI